MQSVATLFASINLVLLLGALSGERNGEKRNDIKKAEKETAKRRSFPWHVRTNVLSGDGLHQLW